MPPPPNHHLRRPLRRRPRRHHQGQQGHHRADELHRARLELRQSEARYRSLFEDAAVPLWEEDFSDLTPIFAELRAQAIPPDQLPAHLETHPALFARCLAALRVVDINRSALAFHEVTTKEDLLAQFSSIINQSHSVHAALRREITALYDGKTFFSDEATYHPPSGRPIHYRMNVRVAPGHEHTLDKIFFSTHDITDQKNALEHILRAKEAAEAADRAKSDFLAFVSHELRTPMNAVLGFARLLADTPLDPRQTEFIRTIEASGQSLLHLINDLLDFACAESSGFEIENTPLLLPDCLQSALDLTTLPAREKNLRLHLDTHPGIPDAILGDASRLRQILLNLIGNAIKFTDTGSISLSVNPTPSEPGDLRPTLLFQVTDTGPGIAPAHAERIFQPFAQGDPATTRRHNGVGLGLAICKRLVERMGGRIGLHSQPGRGSTFWFTLPAPPAPINSLASPSHKPGQPGHDTNLRPLRILLAEDNPVNRRLAALILQRGGHHTTLVSDGAQALAARQASDDFDIILMDLQMPTLDGFAATRAIRAWETSAQPPRRPIPIIALTADTRPHLNGQCLAAGMNGLLSKPITPEALLNRLSVISNQ